VADEQTISNTLATLAASHGVSRSDIHAYFVNDDKQVVGSAEVGYNGGIAFSQGVKGVAVKDYSRTNAYFMKLLGWNTVGASADSTAFLGIVTTIGNTQMDEDAGIFPVGFNGNNTPHVNDAWQACGYSPSIHNATEWSQWCTDPNYSGQGGTTGPTLYDTGWPDPNSGDQTAYSLHWGAGADGWWIPGDPGKSNQQCHNLSGLTVGQQFLVPVFDETTGTGNNARFHMIGMAWFTITHSEIDCNGSHLEIDGRFQRQFTPGASGRHGDIYHSSMVTVFLDN